nr:putative ribonuclease H-like domain-containing protein [Tanacetum cinerariifolium]
MNYMPLRADLSFAGLDNSVFKSKVSETITSVPKIETNASKTCKDSLEKPKTVRPSALLIKEWQSDSEDENVFKHKESGQVPVNAAKQSSQRVAASVSASRRVNTAASRPNLNNALPTTYSYFKAHSPVRTFNQKSTCKTTNFNEKVNTAKVNNVTTVGPKAVVSAAEGNRNNVVKSLACWIWRPKGNLIDYISKDSIFDSRCSRHMTWNKSYPTDCQEIDGGFVAFGGNAKGGTENQMNHKVKTIKCDNGTEFKNSIMNEFCEMKGIRKEFSIARTPQENGVAERKNRTLIEAARTMLADSKFPTTFWAEAVNTACYVQNMVFMKPFGCPVTILNTLDHLGNKTNGNAGTKANIDTGQAGKKTGPGPLYVLLPLLTTNSQGRERAQRNEFESMFGKDKDANGNMMFTHVSATGSTYVNLGGSIPIDVATLPNADLPTDPLMPDLRESNIKPLLSPNLSVLSANLYKGREKAQRNEFKSMFRQDKDANDNRMFSPVSAAGSTYDYLGGSIHVNATTLPNVDLPTDPLMPDLEDTANL